MKKTQKGFIMIKLHDFKKVMKNQISQISPGLYPEVLTRKMLPQQQSKLWFLLSKGQWRAALNSSVLKDLSSTSNLGSLLFWGKKSISAFRKWLLSSDQWWAPKRPWPLMCFYQLCDFWEFLSWVLSTQQPFPWPTFPALCSPWKDQRTKSHTALESLLQLEENTTTH